jgi:hypothetical protein
MSYVPFRRLAAIALLAALPVVTSSCDFSDIQNPIDDFKLIIRLEPVNTTVSGSIYDARTGSLIEQDVTLSFDGADAGSVIDLFSDPVSDLTVRGGVISFGIQNGVIPTDAAPVSFRVLARSDRYGSSAHTLVLRSTGSHDFRVYLMHDDQPPEGVTSATTPVPTQSDGSTSAASTIETPPAPDGQSQAVATIPAGAVMKTASGATLQGGLTARLSVFDPNAPDVSQALPGGMSQNIREGAQTSTGALAVAGLFRMRIRDASGRTAASSSAPVDVRVGIPAEEVNPSTGAPYRAGDRIGLYGFDEATATWVLRSEVTLTEGAGKFLGAGVGAHIRFEGANLNLSDLWSLAMRHGTCSAGAAGAVFNLNRNGYEGAVSGRVDVGASTLRFSVLSGNTFRLRDLASIRDLPDVTASVSLKIPNEQRDVSQSFSPCSGTYTLELPPQTVAPISVQFTVVPRCPGKKVVRVEPPTGSTLTYWLQGEKEDAGVTMTIQPGMWTYANRQLTQARFSISGLKTGATYVFKAFFPPNYTYQTQQVITSSQPAPIEMDAGGACVD